MEAQVLDQYRPDSIMKTENNNLDNLLKAHELIELLKDVKSKIGYTMWPSLSARVIKMIKNLERAERNLSANCQPRANRGD